MREEFLKEIINTLVEEENLTKEELEKKYGKIPENVPIAPTTHGEEEAIKKETNNDETSDKNI